MRRKPTVRRFVLCVKNDECDDLVTRKVYRVIPDEKAEKDGRSRQSVSHLGVNERGVTNRGAGRKKTIQKTVNVTVTSPSSQEEKTPGTFSSARYILFSL